MTRAFSISLRLTAAAVATLAVLSLSGCLYAQIPTGSPSDAPSAGTETDAPADGPSGSTLTFAEGLDLTSDTYIEWGDGLVVDDGWKIVAPDDGNGGWTYGTVDGTCTARFWQGHTTDVAVVPGDDSASSDAILGVLLQMPTADITPLATTGEFSYMAGGNGGVETRQVVGVDGSRTWLMAARAFTQTGVGLSVIVDCTAGDAEATMAKINEENAVVVTP
ncbi:hypothetical protein ABTZ44_07900 [Microbacterium oxydans]|jgi:hypothetical protein|uniref:Uncharacterized protein n=2 Tax=Microbacterium TaxID=33882 RepID=A0A147DYW2_9MICO|nr:MULTISPECIES: hypothetical protein [Microbacterium]AZS42132.1 hypothetical protein CVS54_03494 [Microbacterium oxydans]KTR75957.1 hypothetical protein NS234_13350 [Microbacterium oxydans]MBE7952941.1 hypothetical protein [Microbacterium sp. R1]NYF26697.1 hypothetical protein [Microbacterium sp. JAI119]GED37456.1 hypothetical protein MOX01_05980 [Microbacterium oxydans]